MNADETDIKSVTVNKSRDSKWLLKGITDKTEGRVTRKVARKVTPKVKLRSSSRKQTKTMKTKSTSSKSQAQTNSGRKRKQDNKNDQPPGNVKRGKKAELEQKGKKGRKKSKSDGSRGGVNRVGNKRKKPVIKKKTKAEIVVGDDNVIHIKTGVVDMNERSDENEDNVEAENDIEIQNQPKKRARKSRLVKPEATEDETDIKSSPVENEIPSIEDELKLIEGEKPKVKARRVKKKTSYKQRKPPVPTRHCNLCTQSFYSELELAHHCREVHFKTKFVFKDEGIEHLLGVKRNIVKSSDEVEKEHQYAMENEAMAHNYDRRNSENDTNSAGTALHKAETDQTSDGLVAGESVVVVRKVREEDKKFCPFCEKMFLSSKGLKDHIKMRCSRVPYRCFCGKGLKEPNELHTHYPKFKIPKYKPGLTRLECPNCHQRFSFRETLQNHSLTCTGEENSETHENTKGKRNDSAKLHDCSICDRVFSDRSSLKKHEASHNKEEGTIVCDICGKMFATNGGLRTHREIHSDQKKFICEHCGSGFYQKGNLMQHLKTDIGLCKGLKGVHSLMMECNLCNRSFTSVNRLKQHERKHERMEELNGPDGLVCKDCGKSFTAFHQFKRHQMTHSGERPHKCRFCEKSFTQKSNMMAHMRIHTGYRPYECYICGQGFTQGTTLKIHVEKNHDSSTYKFKKLPRGRRYKDTTVMDDRVVDIEQEYIERALQDGSYIKTDGRKSSKSSSSKAKRVEKENDSNDSKTREISTQADEDDDEYYYDDDSDDDDYVGGDVQHYSSRRQEIKTEPIKHPNAKVQVKEISGRKIYFQVVDDKGDGSKGQHISIDTSVLSDAIKRSLYEPGLHPALDEAIQRTGYVQERELSSASVRHENDNTTDEHQDKFSAPVAEALRRVVQSPRAVVTDSEEAIRRLSEEAVKRSFYEARKVVPATTEALKRFLSQQENVVREPESQMPQVQTQNLKDSSSVLDDTAAGAIGTVHVQTIINSKSVEPMVVLEPQINKTVNKNSINIPTSVAVSESYVTEKYNPIIEAETKEAVIGLQNDQNSIENNENLLQTYQVLETVSEYSQTDHVKNPVIVSQSNTEQYEATAEDEQYEATAEAGVEYVTVIFEDDGTQTIEQEIDLSHTGVATGGHSINIGQDISYVRNVSDVVNAAAAADDNIHVASGNSGQKRNVIHISQ